ncbi:Na+/H+ antiporter NhaC family protein [Colwellia sp. 1_MG-2023]|uniref:Na+/H+ antiporter NhaC family protein n=1 Tax=Colwellia sp. 1_MG-2023 TaxID=3062649 RepID=UPI0026E1DF78|nr:Na+/H+ antiporter NhaC family protein [Colwellia sp. 1_MG-2023]MDO6447039.1 Na+/H+ antiporter NhaC family protein [Colwellia sp. 1_MG-2023]
MNVKHNKFTQALIAAAALLIPVLYGLVIRPLFLNQPALPLEIVFLCAAIVAINQLFILGFSWIEIQQAIAAKLSQAIPTLLLLFAIGLLIGSWIISGTIPMLIYYALKIISVDHIYFIAFIAPIFFSLCTGTSWGSIATIGLVLITVANVINADLAIVTGAIVGGAYFGDKMSPLSDTTNIAAMVVNVDLYQHIHSMMFTTLPSAMLAGLSFFILDFIYPAQLDLVALTNSASNDITSAPSIDILSQTLQGISALFSFHWLLLLPPMIILIGSIKHKPPLPVLVLSSICACLLAFILQAFSVNDIIQTIYKGFDISMADPNKLAALPPHIGVLFNRGGLYALNEPIIITILVFIYVGSIDCINAIPTIINRLLSRIKRSSSLVVTSLFASAITNSMTSSQYANSFIVGEAFSHKYDQFNISRKVLSRSLEDTGTMIESLIPWSTTAVFIYATLGISVQEYWHWQLLSLINIPLAFIFAFLGIAWFKETTVHGK